MKQLIVTAAILPILIAFVMQFTQQQILHSRLIHTEAAIHVAKIEAEANGGFSHEIESNLRGELARTMKVDSSEVVLFLERKTDNNDNNISYHVSVPTGNIIAVPSLFGISKNDNNGRFIFEGKIPNPYYYIEKNRPEDPIEFEKDEKDEQDVSDESRKNNPEESDSQNEFNLQNPSDLRDEFQNNDDEKSAQIGKAESGDIYK